MIQQKSTRSISWYRILIFGLILLCPVLCGLSVMGISIDREVCIPRVAHKINVEPSYEAIYAYIRESVPSGMTHNDALVALEQIGSVSVLFSTKLPDGTIRDDIAINMCWFWLNNIRLYLHYTADKQQITNVVIIDD